MGYVSHQEDDLERLQEGFDKLRQRLPAMAAQNPGDALAFRTYFGDMERMLKEIRGFLDLATDPTVDLARDLAATRKDLDRAGQTASAAETLLTQERGRAARMLAAERALRAKAEQECHLLRRDRDRLQQQLRQLERNARKQGKGWGPAAPPKGRHAARGGA